MGMTERSEPSDWESHGSKALLEEIKREQKKRKKKKVGIFKFFMIVFAIVIYVRMCMEGDKGDPYIWRELELRIELREYPFWLLVN